MNLTSDYPYWGVRNGLVRSYPVLDSDLRSDVVVIGGGITGALIAFHLTLAGVDTVLIDKRDIGTGSTSGSTGLLQYEVDVPLRELVKRIGEKKAMDSYKLCREAIGKIGSIVGKYKIDCEFKRKPSLFLARAKSEISEFIEEFELRRKGGFDLAFLDESEVNRRFSISRPAALFSEDGGEVDPHALTHGLLATGNRRGLRIFDRAKVLGFSPTRRGINLRTDKGFTLRAKRAVVAAGFESMPYLKEEAGSLKSTYALVTEPIKDFKPWHRDCLIWESGSPYLYLRSTPEKRLIVGGEDEDFVNPRRRDELIASKARTLKRKFNVLFPGIAIDVAYAWAGTFGETKDGLAYIGPTKSLPHAYFALGYGGNGITYSVIAAEIIRDDFLGRENPDSRLFRFGR